MRPSRALAAASASLCLFLVAPACGGDKSDSEAEIVDQLTEVIQGADGIDEDGARCFAEIVVDEAGLKELQDIDLNEDEPNADLQEAIAAAALRANDECDLGGGS